MAERVQLLGSDSHEIFLRFSREFAQALRGSDPAPKTLEQWKERRRKILDGLMKSFGRKPESPSSVKGTILSTLERPAYRIERLLLHTFPGVVMTANAYVPKMTGKLPAVLAVHGHWPWARMDPVVQARCHGLAQLGFFVLAVDCFGAGERALKPAKGTYHGALTGATTWPIGMPLAGLQFFENQLAVDYLQSRPEVDGSRIGVTGASGGGNQSMYLGAGDDRIKATVPVCSVGSYQAFLGTACCVCETIPGVHHYTEQAGILALTAPRALLVINATRDARQYSGAEATKTLPWTRGVFELYGAGEKFDHAVFDGPHDYSQPMRERMYGWMTRWLKGEGDGSPIPEPKINIEEIEAIRCFPDGKRPADFMTLPAFAGREGRRLVAGYAKPDHVSQWQAHAETLRRRLRDEVLGGLPASNSLPIKKVSSAALETQATEAWIIDAEEDMPLPTLVLRAKETTKPAAIAVLLDLDGKDAAKEKPVVRELRATGHHVIVSDLRSTGETSFEKNKIADALDHNTAQWSVWLGRPLLGQWVVDVLRLLDFAERWQPGARSLLAKPARRSIRLHAVGPAGIVALAAAALDQRIESVSCSDLLATFVTDSPYANLPMAILAPVILNAADVPQLAALVAPRPLRITGARLGDGTVVDQQRLEQAFEDAQRTYSLLGASKALRLATGKA